MTTPERTWHQYGIAARVLHDVIPDLEYLNWSCLLTLGDEPRLDIGNWLDNGAFAKEYTLAVDMDRPFLTFRVDLPTRETVYLALLDDPSREHIEALQHRILAILTWDVEDVIQSLLSKLQSLQDHGWGTNPDSEHTWEYTGAKDDGTSVALKMDALPAALSITAEIQKGGAVARGYDMIVRHDTNLTDACETLVAYLEGRPSLLAEALLSRLKAALPAEWAPVDSGRGTWYLGPADGDPAPYELDFDDDPDGVYVALSYWLEDDLPCDCCDAQFGYNQIIGDVVTADNMDDVLEGILREIRITHDV